MYRHHTKTMAPTAMSVDEYHSATRAHEVDILAGVMPRLRRNPEKCTGEPKPLAAKPLPPASPNGATLCDCE